MADPSMLAYLLMQQQQEHPPAPNVSPAVPLASMVDRLAPNAVGLQQQNPQLPWWGVPGMFKAGPVGFNAPGAGAPSAPASPVAPAAPVDPLEALMAQYQTPKGWVLNPMIAGLAGVRGLEGGGGEGGVEIAGSGSGW